MKANFLFIVFLSSVLISSCWEPKPVRYKLTDVDILMIPYELDQKISFIDSLGNPFFLTVISDHIGFLDMDEYTLYERRWVNLESDNEYLDIWMYLTNGYSSSIQIYIGKSPFTILYYSCNIDYNNDGQFSTDTANNNFRQYLHKSVEINNKIYYDVVVRKCLENCYLFYNKTDGILQVIDNDKVFFSIVNKDD